MKNLFIILLLFINLNCVAQLSVKFRTEKQSMSTPMTTIEDVEFGSKYYTKPINIFLDFNNIKMTYDNDNIFFNSNIILVNKSQYEEDNIIVYDRYLFVVENNPVDTIIFEIGYMVGYVSVALPTKNKLNEYVGYTLYTEYNEKFKDNIISFNNAQANIIKE